MNQGACPHFYVCPRCGAHADTAPCPVPAHGTARFMRASAYVVFALSVAVLALSLVPPL